MIERAELGEWERVDGENWIIGGCTKLDRS